MSDTDRDLDGALALSQAVRWPYRRDDWRVALDLGQGLLAEADGEIVASTFWWSYGDAFATCGIIIVSPAMQGRGLGRALMDTMLEATSDRTLLLNSTAEGHRLYKSFGFSDIGTVHQHQAQMPAARAPFPTGPVRRAQASDLPAIAKMDAHAFFGAERTRLIETFARIGTAAVIERNGVIDGFALCRPFGFGHAVGPVVAATAADARLLIGHFIAEKAGQFLRVDITGDSGLGDWLTTQGLPEVGNVTTMIRGQRPPIVGPGRIYALASQSFG
ncbi:GNAT family N-acetyltransferase [Sphingomonas bisphenolicum]|uniref:N-acetyltransferase n=1 Tax=Sphingomonas bisphenolicum TaxID=296544 RepID=A0ABM7G4R6_9SPHN|nr:GNAT family N-acetyltransferase [Sphingomonas bisphenolicum]BBF69704.1 N-acetyltransferase [Sphingomonas bisphenolicum]